MTGTSVYLLDVEANKAVQAELFHSIEEHHLADWEGLWVPEQYKAVFNIRRIGGERPNIPQNFHWNWREKMLHIKGYLAYPSFCIVCDGITQGLMIVDSASKRCKLDGQEGNHLIYIEYVEAAPWNRSSLFTPPKYKGVGSILIAAAINLSKEEEFKGRIGLHSLPQANTFYENVCKMINFGPDPDYEDLCYFEMTPEGAEEFLKGG